VNDKSSAPRPKINPFEQRQEKAKLYEPEPTEPPVKVEKPVKKRRESAAVQEPSISRSTSQTQEHIFLPSSTPSDPAIKKIVIFEGEIMERGYDRGTSSHTRVRLKFSFPSTGMPFDLKSIPSKLVYSRSKLTPEFENEVASTPMNTSLLDISPVSSGDQTKLHSLCTTFRTNRSCGVCYHDELDAIKIILLPSTSELYQRVFDRPLPNVLSMAAIIQYGEHLRRIPRMDITMTAYGGRDPRVGGTSFSEPAPSAASPPADDWGSDSWAPSLPPPPPPPPRRNTQQLPSPSSQSDSWDQVVTQSKTMRGLSLLLHIFC
jgi:hypothetical protein